MANRFITNQNKQAQFNTGQDLVDVDQRLSEKRKKTEADMAAEDELAASESTDDGADESADFAPEEDVPEEDLDADVPKKQGMLAKIFSPIPPSQLPSFVPGSERPPEGPPPDNLDGSAGEADDEDEDEDITQIPADDEEWLFSTTDKDPKTGEDFLAAPSDQEMNDLTGSGSEKGDDDFITGVTPEDEEFLTGTTMVDTDGEDFLAAPSEDDVNDLLDIGSDDPFLFSTGGDDDEDDGVEGAEDTGDAEGGEGGEVTDGAEELSATVAESGTEEQSPEIVAVPQLASAGGLDEQPPVAMAGPRVRYTVGPMKPVKSREQKDREMDEFLFGTKGVL